MTQEQIESLKRDFLEWSGGFEPESYHEIVVYVDYACSDPHEPDEVKQVLENWISTSNSTREAGGI